MNPGWDKLGNSDALLDQRITKQNTGDLFRDVMALSRTNYILTCVVTHTAFKVMRGRLHNHNSDAYLF